MKDMAERYGKKIAIAEVSKGFSPMIFCASSQLSAVFSRLLSAAIRNTMLSLTTLCCTSSIARTSSAVVAIVVALASVVAEAIVAAVLVALAVVVAASAVASVAVVPVAASVAQAECKDKKKSRSMVSGIFFLCLIVVDYFLSSMLSPSVGAISSSKSVMPALMRMLYHWMSFLM